MDYLRKILTWSEAVELRSKLAVAGSRLVFTNGCFDLLHPGHLRYLAEARALGDFLLVGLNSDSSIQSLKGPLRPISLEGVRAEMLAGLASVDAVVLFGEETPLALITALSPDVLVKGGDWPADCIVGAETVNSRGGLVRSLSLVEGFSTTALIAEIQKKV